MGVLMSCLNLVTVGRMMVLWAARSIGVRFVVLSVCVNVVVQGIKRRLFVLGLISRTWELDFFGDGLVAT